MSDSTGYLMPVDTETLALWLKVGLLRPVRRSEDGTVTEYELTHAGRVFASRITY